MTPRIRWAPKVAQAPVARLYERDASGIQDDELLNEVGYELWARAADVALVARSGVRCPIDRTECSLGEAVWYRLPADASATCPTCGWQTTVAEWHDSFRKQDLNAMAPFFDVYVAMWPHCSHLSRPDAVGRQVAARGPRDGRQLRASATRGREAQQSSCFPRPPCLRLLQHCRSRGARALLPNAPKPHASRRRFLNGGLMARLRSELSRFAQRRVVRDGPTRHCTRPASPAGERQIR